MNKKVIFIAVGSALAIILAIVAYAFTSTGGSKPATQGQNPPVAVSTDPTVFNTAKGTVRTANFTSKPVFRTDTTLVIADTDQYQIIYLIREHTFQILISAPPANMSRNLAENALLKILGVSQDDACKLPVAIKIPYSVDQSLAGPEYGLSFCNPNIKK
jgi:hypothetical protein